VNSVTGSDGDGVITATLDFEEMQLVRDRMPVVNHRRSEVIDIVVGDNGARLKIVRVSASQGSSAL